MYMESFQRTRLGRQDKPFKPLAVRTLAEQQAELPDWRLDHLSRLTDSTGMFQHAKVADQGAFGSLDRNLMPVATIWYSPFERRLKLWPTDVQSVIDPSTSAVESSGSPELTKLVQTSTT
jgi:hypothetical protein